MAVTYDAAVKTARITATRDQVANGTLEIGTASMAAVLATLAFDAGTVAAGAAGTAAAARIKDSGGTARITGLTVGTSGSDINLDNTSIANGQNVTLSSATLTHA
jgi:hypothetical protein